jgi:hypothetical protein
VKIMTAGASAGLPNLPADFWTTWPNSAGDGNWTPIGAPQTIATLDPLRPAVLQWNWTPPSSADTHSCMLVVVDTPSDPIPLSTKSIFDIGQLVTTEKHVALKNLHVVNLLADSLFPVPFYLYASRTLPGPYQLRIPVFASRNVSLGWLLSQTLSKNIGDRPPRGVTAKRLPAADLERIKKHWLERELRDDASWREFQKTYDLNRIFTIDTHTNGVELPVAIKAGSRESMVLLFRSDAVADGGKALGTLTIVQAAPQGQIVGGSTFVFKPARR